MDELNPTVREQEIYEEMELPPEMVKSIRTLCGTCLRHFVDAKAFKIALVPSPDRSMDTCTVCQMRRGYDYVVMHRCPQPYHHTLNEARCGTSGSGLCT